MDISVVNNSGEKTGRSVSLAPEVFGVEPNDHAIWLDVKSFLANQRQGTHKAKERNEITGSSKKSKKEVAERVREISKIRSSKAGDAFSDPIRATILSNSIKK